MIHVWEAARQVFCQFVDEFNSCMTRQSEVPGSTGCNVLTRIVSTLHQARRFRKHLHKTVTFRLYALFAYSMEVLKLLVELSHFTA